ncbi:MAG: LuxR C-terminal-related transcriptional regulator [Lachnospiraceae bacterium]|nr:LuxR C-terminal-related transcriptional regulator [Lachnospiraceae bacterium]
MKRKSVFLALLGGLIYIWTGTLYISVAYTFFDHYDDTTVCLITDVYFALLQVLGYVFAMLAFKKSKKALEVRTIAIESGIVFLTGVLAFLSAGNIATILWGSFMSFFIGTVMCYVLTIITLEAEFSQRGKAFGLIYALGSVGTLLLSLPDEGNALGNPFILIIYAILAGVSLFLMFRLYGRKEDSLFGEEEYLDPVVLKPDRKDVALFFIIFMFFVLSNIGLHFKVPGGARFESAIFSRSFYAIGLLLAGFLADMSRRMGALSAFLALGFGLLSPALQINAGTSALVQILAYIFLGFPALYRMTIFSDEAEADHSKFPIATLGVAAALLGQALGTFLGIRLEENMTVLVCVMLFLYILTGGGFFAYFTVLYPNPKKADDLLPAGDRREMAFEQYVQEKGLNTKQVQVLKLILDGASNGEIAERLFVAESTVKYHVKHILQATGCHNRNELIEDFRKHYLNP